MNFKTTIVLIILLAGIGTYLLVTNTSNKPDETKPVVKTLLDVKSADVSGIAVTTADGKQLAAQKSTDAKGMAAWKLTQPVNAAADTYKVGSLVDEVTSLKSKNIVPESGPDAPTTGIDHPQYTIELTAGGKKSKLLVGNALQITDGVYVKVDGQSDVAVVDASLLSSLEKPAGDLRKTQLFETSSSAVQKVTITHKDGTQLSLEKQGKGWQIVKPTVMPAEQFAVEDLLSAVLNLTPVSFVDDASQAIGLNKPADVVSFSTAAPSSQPTTAPVAGMETVKFGGYDDLEKKNIYVQLPDGSVVKAAAGVLDSLNKKPMELRDKTVVDLDPEKVERVVIAINQPATTQPVAAVSNRSTTLERRKKDNMVGPVLNATTKPTTGPSTAPAAPASTWVLAGTKPVDADDAKITALLAQLHPLKADKFLESSSTTQPSKQYTVTLTLTGQAAPAVLTLTDPGNDASLIGTYNGLTFNLSRTIATDLSAEFKK